MKRKIAAIISFIGGLGWGTFVLYSIVTESENDNFWSFDYVGVMLLVLIPCVSVCLHIIWTSFGKQYSELEKIDYENQLLKRKIEHKELKKQLEE